MNRKPRTGFKSGWLARVAACIPALVTGALLAGCADRAAPEADSTRPEPPKREETRPPARPPTQEDPARPEPPVIVLAPAERTAPSAAESGKPVEPSAKAEPLAGFPPAEPEKHVEPPSEPPKDPPLPRYVRVLERTHARQAVSIDALSERSDALELKLTNVERFRIDRRQLPETRGRSVALRVDSQTVEWQARHVWLEFARDANGFWQIVDKAPSDP